MKAKKSIILTLFIGFVSLIYATNPGEKVSLNGYVKDNTNGEVLIGATISIKGKGIGVATNNYGFYSLKLPQGTYEIDFNYVGYKTVTKKVTLDVSTRMNVELTPDTRSLQEVTVTADRKDANVKRN
ncbi:MAG: carboxypeptidase-like regulatory domain-containing protein, partial [Bacteroidota bacterium]|nr:carboxypeptidase-like regulatory domain-containing protein [Bacteroidota bacterium]